MLVEVYMESFALIDQLRLRLGAGFNVLTGETGAGKSIVIDAVELVLGGRASADYVRTGADRALIEAAFDIDRLPAVAEVLAGFGFEPGGETLVLSREVHRTGRSVSRINGRPATQTMVRELSRHLLDLHGQHEHQSLLATETHRELIDLYGGTETAATLTAVSRLTADIAAVNQQLLALGGDERDRARRQDLLAFQIQEIDAAGLHPGEEQELAHDRRLLANAEKLAAAVQGAYAAVYEGSPGQQAAVDLLGTAEASLQDAARVDSDLSPLLDLLASARVQVDEAARELAAYRDGIEYDPARLVEVEQRLDLLASLKRKYGESVEEILAFRAAATGELEQMATAAERRAELQHELAALMGEYAVAAQRLHGLREQAGAALAQAVVGELADLQMDQARFAVDVRLEESGDGPAVHSHGADQVEFLFSANPGEPLRPLVRVASGGELARVALALKVALAKVDRVPCLIFDEIDTGVSGRTAAAVGRKMDLAAAGRQVICVTHHPQIAALADHHVLVHKHSTDGRMATTLEVLDESGRVDELARMLGGETITAVTREHAREMLQEGRGA